MIPGPYGELNFKISIIYAPLRQQLGKKSLDPRVGSWYLYNMGHFTSSDLQMSLKFWLLGPARLHLKVVECSPFTQTYLRHFCMCKKKMNPLSFTVLTLCRLRDVKWFTCLKAPFQKCKMYSQIWDTSRNAKVMLILL